MTRKVTLFFLLGFLFFCVSEGLAGEQLAKVTAVEGTVEVQKAGAKDWVAGRVGMSLGKGDKVQTKAKSKVVIKWPDGSMIKLFSYSNFAIEQASFDSVSGASNTRVGLWIGKVYTQVKKVLLPGSSFSIKTPNVICGVRSTAWTTSVLGSGETWVSTYAGEVLVSALGQTVSVGAGMRTRVLAERPPEPPQAMSEEEKISEEEEKISEEEEEEEVTKEEKISEEEEISKEEEEKEIEEPPFSLDIEKPGEGLETDEKTITISGKTSPGATMTINGVGVAPNALGHFSKEITLNEGENTITIRATNPAGKVITIVRKIRRKPKKPEKPGEGVDDIPPLLTVSQPLDNLVTNLQTLTIIGNTEVGAKVTVGGAEVKVAGDGSFSKDFILTEGVNLITILARDAADNQTTVKRSVTLDTIPPLLTITQPVDNLITNLINLSLMGVTEEKAKLKVNDLDVPVVAGGSFDKTLILQEGKNTIRVEAKDEAGNLTTVVRLVTLDTIPPVLTVTEPAYNQNFKEESTITIRGITEPKAKLFINEGEVFVDEVGNFSKEGVPLAEGVNYIKLGAKDKAGNKTLLTWKVRHILLPPDAPGSP